MFQSMKNEAALTPVLVLLVAGSLLLGLVAACGGGSAKEINISGSSTVYPVTTAVAEQFQKEHPDVSISISRDGSSGGFENAFLPGRSDINNSSRPITQREIQEARDNGFEVVEFLVARDALTAVVNNENHWVGDCVTLDTLRRIWTPENQAETWGDVNSDWPSEEIVLYGPASTSGTFDYFTETVVGETGKIRPDFDGTEEDDLIAQGVEGSKYATGYLPFAYYDSNPDEVKALQLDGGNGCVEPSLENASSGEYPLARPLFIYVNKSRLQESEVLQEYVRFYIKQTKNRELIAEDIGYVPMSKEQVQENLEKLEQAINE